MPEIKETEKVSQKIKAPEISAEDALVIGMVRDHIQRSRTYRDKFRSKWDDIEKQIRCEKPEAWNNKEDWQTKIFIPLQAKKSETARAYLDRMLFGQKRFYDIQGVESKDRERDTALMDLYDNFFNRGRFFYENDFVTHEDVDIGTSFLKILVKDGINPLDRHLIYKWRSAYNILFDPSVGEDFYRSTYVIDETKIDISELISEVQNGTSIYSKEKLNQFLAYGATQNEGESDRDKMTVRGIDGTTYSIPTAWKTVIICEYWGKVLKERKKKINTTSGDQEIPEWAFEDRIITTFNDTFIARNEENPYGFIPIFIQRCKKRKYETYGLGFCENTTGLQELMNSMVNLGFDSLKLNSMDIIGVDVNKVADQSSIEYKPAAIWKFKGDPRQAMDKSRQGLSALSDIIRGITMLDQIDQEASGVFRSIQGAPELGAGSGSETLGEYQAKLQLIDQRFLKIGRFIERDYIEPILRGMFKIISNPKFFNQQILNRILGMKETVKEVPTGQIDPNTQQEMTQQVTEQTPRLNFEEIKGISEMGLDFKAVGMTQFFNKIENIQKMEKILSAVLNSQPLMVLSRVDRIWKRALQMADIPDYEDLLKDPEDVKKIMSMGGMSGAPQQPPPGTPPQRPIGGR